MAEGRSNLPISVDRRARSAVDKAMIVAFIVGGGATIIVLKLMHVPLGMRLGAPVALIFAYAALTTQRTRFRLRFDQAGDNCYYLGFIYTLFSLGVALYQIQSRTQSSEFVAEVIRDFGVGLASTIVGIALRVWLNQLREDPADIEEAVQSDLLEQGNRISGQIRAAIVALDDVRQDTADKMKNYVFVLQQVAEEHEGRVAQLKDATIKLADSVEKLAKDLQSAEIPTGQLRDAAASTISELQKAAAAISGIDKASQELTAQFASTGRSLEGVARQSEGLSEATAKSTTTIVSAGQALEQFAISTADAREKLAGSTEMLASGQQALADAARGFAQAVVSQTASVRAASNHPTGDSPQTSLLHFLKRS